MLKTLIYFCGLIALVIVGFVLYVSHYSRQSVSAADLPDFKIASFHDGVFTVFHDGQRFTAKCYREVLESGASVDGPDVCTYALHNIGRTISGDPSVTPHMEFPSSELWYVLGEDSQRMRVISIEPAH